MSEIREERTVVKEVHVGSRPVIETRRDSVVNERQGMSGGAIAALIIAGITAAVLITVMVINSQQRESDQAIAQEKARTLAAQEASVQPGQMGQQQPVIVNMPQNQQQPAVIPYPVPVPAQPAAVEVKTGPSNGDVEADVNSRLRSDEVMRLHSVDVKVTGGTAMLSGSLPGEDLKNRAEKIARSAEGVKRVINDIVVRP